MTTDTPQYEPPFALLSTRQAAELMGVTPRHVPRVLTPVLVIDGRSLWAEPDALAWKRKGARVASPPARFTASQPAQPTLAERTRAAQARAWCRANGHAWRTDRPAGAGQRWCRECLTLESDPAVKAAQRAPR